MVSVNMYKYWGRLHGNDPGTVDWISSENAIQNTKRVPYWEFLWSRLLTHFRRMFELFKMYESFIKTLVIIFVSGITFKGIHVIVILPSFMPWQCLHMMDSLFTAALQLFLLRAVLDTCVVVIPKVPQSSFMLSILQFLGRPFGMHFWIAALSSGICPNSFS